MLRQQYLTDPRKLIADFYQVLEPAVPQVFFFWELAVSVALRPHFRMLNALESAIFQG